MGYQVKTLPPPQATKVVTRAVKPVFCQKIAQKDPRMVAIGQSLDAIKMSVKSASSSPFSTYGALYEQSVKAHIDAVLGQCGDNQVARAAVETFRFWFTDPSGSEKAIVAPGGPLLTGMQVSILTKKLEAAFHLKSK